MMTPDTFVLAGNGSYLNRGCEAIVRGTVCILRRYFEAPRFVVFSHLGEEDSIEAQRKREFDGFIEHGQVRACRTRFDAAWWATNVLRRAYPPGLQHLFYKDLKPFLPKAAAVLAVGGDNYGIDYHGRPIACTALDDLVVSHGKPLIIWGASVGPFTKDPPYERYMSEHLRQAQIFSREPLTTQYLNSLGLTDNVHPVADPAFLMDPVEPPSEKIDLPWEEGAIGINLSPLLAKYCAGKNLDAWADKAAAIVKAVARKTERPIYLIPHVTGINAGHCDYSFLRSVADRLGAWDNHVHVVPDTLNAAETKWVIGRMDLFAGARTHSTIAALSLCAPTLSFGYSMKSRGINEDVYGHTRYCLQPKDLSPECVAEALAGMLKESEAIRTHLRGRIPEVKENALRAGHLLKGILAQTPTVAP